VPPPLARLLALGGLLFFADSLLYFVYRYVVVFGRETVGPTSKLITRFVGALERSVYVWIASALFIAVCALWRPVAGVAWRVNPPVLVWCIVAAQLVGMWLALRSAALIDIRELSGLKPVDSHARQVQQDPPSSFLTVSDPPAFKTDGPYGWVRHPIYSGWFLIVFAVPVMTMTRLVFAITSSLYLLIAIPFEERSLRHSSQGGYDQYMRKVRWRLVPRLF
jgi:hypothetical protein